ncbi:MAG: ABC transporter ATP-binding protein [Thiotrichaceae bacterium]
MATPVIALHNLCFCYPQQPAILQQLDFKLYSGEKVALTGANGSGKSTLLHLLLGLQQPSAGEIIIFGQRHETEADFVKIRGRVGLLLQDADDQLFCPTVVEDVAFGPLNLGKTQREAREIVDTTLNLLGLQHYATKITYKLSGGEKRLVALATVLAMQPEVLLLDEPTAGLDEATEQRVIDLLRTLPQAMLIVSHDNNFLQQVTQRTVKLIDGKLLNL